MFQLISIIGFIGVIAFIALHYLTRSDRGQTLNETQNDPGRPSEVSAPEPTLFGHVKRLSLAVIVVCFVVLTLTGFIPPLLFSELLSGFPLVLHVGLAPVFVVCVVFAVFVWAYHCQLTGTDWEQLKRRLSFKGASSVGPSSLGYKLTFWIGALLVIPVSLSIVAGMFPIFGTHGQETLIEIHKYTSLFLVLTAILHLYFLVSHRFAAPLGNPIPSDPEISTTTHQAAPAPEPTRSPAKKSPSRPQTRRRRPQPRSGEEKRPSRRKSTAAKKRTPPKRARSAG